MAMTLNVALGARSYPIYIGAGLLSEPELIRSHLVGRQAMIVTNETVAPLYLEPVRAALSGSAVRELILPDGERFKTLAVLDRIFDALMEAHYGRDCTLIALGGGVVGDMVGFAAACFQRGVAFLQIPTTLLAQVDSSVGGKTGINHAKGKNMIGAFHQPRAVIADTETLNTLPDRELSAGLAEVIKYGLIRDSAFFEWIDAHLAALKGRDPQALAEAVRRSCENKADVVAEDELESGNRALLNLGHTFGHAIETGAGYGNWLHGEAVGAGICMAADLSAGIGWLGVAEIERIRDLISRAGLPTQPPPDLTPDRFLELMAVDKKVQDGRLRLVLLKSIGEALVTDRFDPDLLRATLAGVR